MVPEELRVDVSRARKIAAEGRAKSFFFKRKKINRVSLDRVSVITEPKRDPPDNDPRRPCDGQKAEPKGHVRVIRNFAHHAFGDAHVAAC